jgi:tetratricopeptide (TPR) repeat protein
MTAREVVAAALQRELAERDEFVCTACAGDEALLAEVRSLLDAEVADSTMTSAPLSIDSSLGTIGPYKLLRKIGEGGMGAVYQARQQEPIRREVALKVIKPGMDSRQVIARFESERQSLALMDHPNIARVFDAGATERGLPYFVMELVDGAPITSYCDHKGLSVRQRIELFLPVCQAIQHAHQKGIIHRDIKPSNVLVKQQETSAIPKVIDFGLAKALAAGALGEAATQTQLGSVVGTLDYMSPEQAELGRQDIDTRSDVYSLGALLYELLTGVAPLEYDRSSRPSYLEVLGWIRDKPVLPPSVRAKHAGGKAKPLGRELDWIVMKALEKDRARRYETVNGLLRDLQRYLAGEPVEAGPPSTAYRLRKFAGRHRVALGTSAALAAILAGATVYSAREAARARQAERVAEAVSDFLQQDVLAQASTAEQGGPGTKLDPDIKVRTALDRAAAKVGSTFKDQPAVEASVRNTIAKAYADLGLYRESREQSLRAIERNRLAKGAADHATLLARYRICVDDYGLGQYKEGEEMARALLQTGRKVLPPSDPLTMNALDILATHLNAQGKFQEGETALKEGIALAKRSGQVTHDTLHVQLTLGTLYRDWGKFHDAETVDSQVLEGARQTLGADHPTALAAMGALAEDYRLEGKYADAERVALETAEAKKRALGPEHPETMVARNNLANAYVQQGKFADAEQLHRQVAEFDRRTRPADDPDALTPWANLATDIYAQGRFAEAEAIERDVFEKRIQLLGRDHWLTLLTSDLLGGAIAAQGRLAEAEALYSESAQIARQKMGLKNPNTLATLNRLATVYRLEGKLDRAEALQIEVVENMKQALGEDHPSRLTAMGNLAYTRYLLHKDQEAIDLAQAAIAKFESRFPDLWTHFRAEAILGAALAEEKKYADAESHLLKGYQGMLERKSRMTADTWFYLDSAAKWTAAMYRAWGKPDKAAEWRSKAQSTGGTTK